MQFGREVALAALPELFECVDGGGGVVCELVVEVAGVGFEGSVEGFELGAGFAEFRGGSWGIFVLGHACGSCLMDLRGYGRLCLEVR